MRSGRDYESRHALRRPAGRRLPAANACKQVVVFKRGVTVLQAVTAATATVNTVGRRWRCLFRYGPGQVGTPGEESRPPVGALSGTRCWAVWRRQRRGLLWGGGLPWHGLLGRGLTPAGAGARVVSEREAAALQAWVGSGGLAASDSCLRTGAAYQGIGGADGPGDPTSFNRLAWALLGLDWWESVW